MVGFGSSPFSLDLIVFVRLITATEDQLKRWEDDQHLKEVARKAWVQGDQKVLEFLEKRFKTLHTVMYSICSTLLYLYIYFHCCFMLLYMHVCIFIIDVNYL